MKRLVAVSALATLFVAPAYGEANGTPNASTPKSASQGVANNCPMMSSAGTMQKDLGIMMSDVEMMMKETTSTTQKAHLQSMHDRLTLMMTNMQQMGGMMKGRAMHGMMLDHHGAAAGSPSNDEVHHPAQ